MRCLALADALVDRGWRCVFAVSAETTATVPHLKRAQHDIHILSAVEEGDPAALLSAATEGCQLLVIDHYRLGAHYEAGCRSLTRQILVIDDLADRAHDCDLLLDQNFLVAIPSTMMVLCPLRLGCLPGRNSRFCVQNSRVHGLQASQGASPGHMCDEF